MNIIKKKPLNKKERQEMKTNTKSNPQVKFRPNAEFIWNSFGAFFIIASWTQLAYAITTFATHTHPTSSLEVISHTHAPNITMPHTHTPGENLQIQAK